MNKNIILLFMYCILSMTACAQDNSQPKRSGIPECGCGISFGAYTESYIALNDKDWDTISSKLDIFLNCKDIQVSRATYSSDVWFTLMRLKDIEWTTHKADVLNYLSKFVKKILAGDSYLTQSNRNILYDDRGCFYGIGDPMKIPFACYWVILKLDTEYGVTLINDTWQELSANEPFSNNFRNDIINALKDYYKNDKVQLLLEKIEKQKMTKDNIEVIAEIKDKYEVYKINNQPKAWERLIVTLPVDLSGSGQIWQKNINNFKEVFGEVDISIPLKLAEQEKNLNKRYWLAYSCCGLVNGNYPNKVDNELIQRIDKLVNEVQKEITPLKKGANGEIDYLNVAYQALKKWHK
jgi:hypothetical protein